MTITVKPFETEYNGYRFRSRLEARWAVFFDAVGIEYEYESEGFESEDGTRYLPDFYLPNENAYVEIKGKPLSDKERNKIEKFCRAKCDYINGGSRFRLLRGQIPSEIIYSDEYTGIPAFVYVSPDEFEEIGRKVYGIEIGKPEKGVLMLGSWSHHLWSKDISVLTNALLKARQARFEFGEHGGITK